MSNVAKVSDGRFIFNPKQQLACWTASRAPAQSEILYHGAIGTGKTEAFSRLLVAWAFKYGGTYVVSRLTYRELEDSTKKVICHGVGGLPPACPRELLRGSDINSALHEGHNRLTLRNGAEILFRSLEPKEREKIRNMTIAGWLIDQAEELEDEDIVDFYLELKGRLRDPRGPRKVLLVANPSREDHWLHERFIEGPKVAARAIAVHTDIFDNVMNLPPDTVEDLLATEHTQPDFYKRMVLGLWGQFGGKRFKQWDRTVHVVKPFDIPAEWEIVESWDYGYDHPTVAIWSAIDHEGGWVVCAEHVARETRISDHAKAAKEIRENRDGYLGFHGQLEPSSIWMDPSAFAKRSEHSSTAIEFLEHGIFVARANNDRIGGWNRLDEFLAGRLYDGSPRLRVFETCPHLIKEIPNLRIKPGTDDVEKVNDDCSDALRYGILSKHPTPLKPAAEGDKYSRRSIGERYNQRVADREAGRTLFTGAY